MIQRVAVSLSLIAFAVCLLVGGVEVGNPFTTTVLRALAAMAVTLVVGLILGAMLQAMLDESVKMEREKLKKNPAKPEANNR
jgi:hypothetical protein